MNCPIDPPACHPEDEDTIDDVDNFLAWRGGSVPKGAHSSTKTYTKNISNRRAYKKTSWKPRQDEADAHASYLRATRK
jgi:hypothetical protein